MISLATSNITEQVRKNVIACLDENRIGNGRFIKEFEEKTAAYLGVKHAISVCNGTIADIVALAALRVKRPEKNEVIVPALTFVAHANSVLFNGLIPVFVDVGEDYQIDVSQIEKNINESTLAIMPANLLGRACDIKKIRELANKYNVYVVEDNCEAFGMRNHEADFSTYSFYPSHTITTGEGGMVVTDNDGLAKLARDARNHGRRNDNDVLDKFHFDTLGINGKMANINAAIGAALIDIADEVIKKRVHNVDVMNAWLEDFDFSNKVRWYASSPHCYPKRYSSEEERDRVLMRLEDNEVEARKLFSCLPVHEKVYAYTGYKEGSFPVAERIGKTSLFVPIHQDLTSEDIQYICSLL
jgi:perosamine synthetase